MFRQRTLILIVVACFFSITALLIQHGIASEKKQPNAILISFSHLEKTGVPLKSAYESTKEYYERLERTVYSLPVAFGSMFRTDWDITSAFMYDADQEVFNGNILTNSNIVIFVKRAKARELAGRTSKLHLEGKLRYFNEENAEIIDVMLIDEVTNERFPIFNAGIKLSHSYVPKPTIKERLIENIHDVPDFKSALRKDDMAVVIGIEHYQSLPNADYSKSDAGIVKDYLKAMGFQERNIEFLTDERATKSGVEKTIEAWLPNRVKRDSRVFIYYSGHGAPDPISGEAYLVPYDGDPNYLSVTGYPLKRMYDKLGKLQSSEVVIVLDSCFSGAGGRSVLAKGARPLVMTAEGVVLSPNMAVLTAAQGSEISISSPEKMHGIFTYFFLKAIKDGKKNLSDIYEYIKPLVEDEAKLLNVAQSPSINPKVERVRGRFNLRP